MPKLVFSNQVSFVPSRHIQNNIIIVHELVYTLQRLRGNKKFIAIKVDLEKAYDHLDWNFIANMLE